MIALGDEKMALLEKKVNAFNQAMYWGDSNGALLFTTLKSRDKVKKVVKGVRKKINYVNLEVQDIDLEEDKENDKATIKVEVEYYKVPHYMIKTRTEIQEWVFYRFDGGWKLDDFKIKEEIEDTK